MIDRKIGVMATLVFCLVIPLAAQQTPAPAGATDHVAALKQSLQTSMAALRQYEWVETTVVSVKGDEKSRTQKDCYYGADGKVEKVPIDPASESSGKKQRGLRGRIVENKQEEMTESMQEAVALVKQYVPPDPARIDAAKQAGKLSVSPPDSKGLVQVVIKDYLKPGDSLALALNAAADRLSGMTISTYTDKEKNTVGLNVAMGTFADGTIYPATIHLDVAKENLAVAIDNSGYKKRGG